VQVAPTGQKMRLVVDMATAKEIHEKLSEFCEFYGSLGKTHFLALVTNLFVLKRSMV